uniref:FRIGIDA-like protein n=1 Tax=Raphanus sativus TaxID=3726 RepID=A0A290GB32_RAPSA|nr:FRIGIDA-like protein [Raphanus sativus]
MAVRNGSLIPAHDPSTRENQPSILRSGELPATVKTVPTNNEITIEQSNHPQFLKSIDDLTAFSAAVNTFKRHYDDLQSHMDYINTAIDSNLKSKAIAAAAAESRNDASVETATAAVASQSPPPAEKEVERLCELMCSKGLRRYMYSNISDRRAKLIEELPAALKLAKEPAKFVLECIGKFYLQGRKAYASDSHMIPARQVSLLILECYLLMLDPARQVSLLILECYLLMLDPKKPIDSSSIKDEAEAAAVAWKKRMMNEGRLAAAEAMDAKGLLLLISCFGIPSSFTSMDLFDLVRKSGAAEIAAALKRSPFFVPMMSGIVDSSIKRGKHIEALEMVYTFGIEDRFSASSLLSSFLRMSKESFEKAKQKAQAPIAFREANQKFFSCVVISGEVFGGSQLRPRERSTRVADQRANGQPGERHSSARQTDGRGSKIHQVNRGSGIV